LKDKRKVVAQLRDRLTARHRVAVAEVGWLEDAVRGVVAVSMVGNDAQHVRASLDALAHQIAQWSAALIEDVAIDVMRPWDEGGSAIV
jgi:uncharacterized protein YlxP (DUF503 family)